MNADLSTYELAHFIPFTREVYDRLFVRLNTEWLPLPILTVLLGAVALWAALRLTDRRRSLTVGLILAAAWAWVGWAYYLRLYTPLNWAGPYAAGAAFTQAALLLGLALAGRLDARPPLRVRALGATLAALGLALVPLLDLIDGRPWTGVELFGHAPEPTAIVTLGLLLATARDRLVTFIVPIACCALGAAPAWVFDTPLGLAPLALAALTALAALAARHDDRATAHQRG